VKPAFGPGLPIKARLITSFVVFLTLVLVGLGAFLVLRLRADLRSTINRGVRASSVAIKDNYVDEGPGGFDEVSAASLPRVGALSQVLGPKGHVLISYGGDTAQDPMVPQSRLAAILAGSGTLFQTNLGDSSQPFRVMATPVTRKGKRQLVVVAESLSSADEAVRRTLVLLLVVCPVAIILAGIGGWVLVRNALAPVERMRRKAQQIGIDRMHERLVAPYPNDEIGGLAETLNEMLDRLEAGVIARQRLVADASHELRTPLAAMRAELDVNLRDNRRTRAERAVLHSVREEVDRMSRIVSSLLTLARADDGRLPVSLTHLELDDVVRAAVTQLESFAAQKGIELRIEDGSVAAEADGERLQQALANLIENAIEFSPKGGVVTISTWQNADEAGLTVSDEGPGISKDAQRHVFERFYKADPSRSRESGGAGLGLAISYEIAHAHQGRIWVESEPGKGSSFSIAVPANRQRRRGERRAADRDGRPSGSERRKPEADRRTSARTKAGGR
jgi:heavy metal sensor kinase